MSVQIIKDFNKTFEFLLEQFILYALPEKQNILTKNEQFFLSKINENDLFSLNNIYNQLNETSKKNLWDIIHALLFLSEDYINKKTNITSEMLSRLDNKKY